MSQIPPPSYNEKGKPSRNMTAKARRAQAVELWAAGYSYDRIAEVLGYSGRSSVNKALETAFEQQEAASVEMARARMLFRLDKMMTGIWHLVIKGHLGSMDRALKIIEREAKILGLDAPMQLEVDFEAELRDAGVDPSQISQITEIITQILTAALSGEVPHVTIQKALPDQGGDIVDSPAMGEAEAESPKRKRKRKAGPSEEA